MTGSSPTTCRLEARPIGADKCRQPAACVHSANNTTSHRRQPAQRRSHLLNPCCLRWRAAGERGGGGARWEFHQQRSRCAACAALAGPHTIHSAGHPPLTTVPRPLAHPWQWRLGSAAKRSKFRSHCAEQTAPRADRLPPRPANLLATKAAPSLTCRTQHAPKFCMLIDHRGCGSCIRIQTRRTRQRRAAQIRACLR